MGVNRNYRECGKSYKTRQIGVISKWMGLSDEGIRLYERYGIIHPEKDEQNNYRAFDVMDMGMLLYGMVYRESGFSMKETQKLANGSSIDEVYDAYLKKIELRRQELEREHLKLARVEEIAHEIEQAKLQEGMCFVEERPAMYRLEFMEWQATVEDASKQKYTNHWLKNYLPFVMISTRYYEDTLSNSIIDIEAAGGYGVYARYAKALGIEENEHIQYYPPVRAVHTILSSNNEVLNPDYTKALRYIEENKLRVCGDPISFGIVNLNFNKEFKRYYHIWIPVEDDV